MSSEDAAWTGTHREMPCELGNPPERPVATRDGIDADEWGRLLGHYRDCGPNARGMIVDQAKRLAIGAGRYGDDFDDGRDWTDEPEQEFGDGIHYSLALLRALPDSHMAHGLVHLGLAGVAFCRAVKDQILAGVTPLETRNK